MRGLSQPSITIVENNVDMFTSVKQTVKRWHKKTRQFLCVVVNGGHELYRAHSDTKLYQQCLLCGYETNGWTVDRRDRKLHLVTKTDRKTGTK